MIKLLRGNIKRITKSKTFWICSAAYLLYDVTILIATHLTGDIISFPTTNLCLSGSPFTGVIILIFINVILGSDFKNNTIRNKIIMGHSKSNIYLSNTLACAICAIALNLVFSCITLAFLPTPYLARFIDQIFAPKKILEFVLAIVLNNVLTAVFYVSLYTLLIMNFKNAVASIICGILLNACAIALTSALLDVLLQGYDMWAYIILYMYPTGQNALIANGEVFGDITAPIISVIMTAFISAVGVLIFKKSKIN